MNTDEWMDRVVVAAIRWHETREAALDKWVAMRGEADPGMVEERRLQHLNYEAFTAERDLSRLIRQKP